MYLSANLSQFMAAVEHARDAIRDLEDAPFYEGPEEFWPEVFSYVDDLRQKFYDIVEVPTISIMNWDYRQRGLKHPGYLKPPRKEQPQIDLRELKKQLVRDPDAGRRGELALRLAYELVGVFERGDASYARYDTFPSNPPDPEGPWVLLEPYRRNPGAAVIEGEWHWSLATSRWEKEFERNPRSDIERLLPPLTWEEVLYYYVISLEDNRGAPEADRRRRELFRCIAPSARVFCLECDNLFEISRNNPSRLVCPRCNDRKRQRRHRAKKASQRQVHE